MNVTRTGIVLKPDVSRVLFRPFTPAGEERPLRILARVLALPESDVVEMLSQVLSEFKTRHQRLHDYFLTRYEFVRGLLPTNLPLTESRRLLNRGLLHPRIFPGSRRALQSLHRSPSRPNRRGGGGAAIHREPARHG